MYNEKFAAIYDKMGWEKFSHDIFRDIKRLKLKRVDVLDIACGTGTFACLMAKDGHKVWAFDRSRAMIKIAKKKNCQAKFFVDDMKIFNLDRQFDLITCFFDSINHIRNWRAFFRRVAKHLKPGGIFIFDFNTIAGLRNWGKVYVDKRENGYVIFQGKYDAKKRKAELRCLCFVSDKNNKYFLVKDKFISYSYPLAMIKLWLKQAGFDFCLFRPKQKRRIFLICQKK